jgi:hypothetical protein
MFHNLINTQYFREAGINYFKNGGHYTLAPRGSMEYYEFWKQEEKRCREGYRVGDIWITGRHYFHLNYQPMIRVKEDMLLQEIIRDQRSKVTNKISKRTAETIFAFPFFTEMQYEWWRFKHIAWNGGQFMGIDSPGGKHIVCGKTREAGFSYMEAADGVYNFNFIPRSKSYYAASKEDYLIADGILNKALTGMDWINENCPAWSQHRHKHNSITDMLFRASFVDEFGEERGTMAELHGVTINSDPNKIRGKRGMKITFEEAGSFKNLMATLEIAKGNISAGTAYRGQISVFGTGGEEGPSIEGLESLFTNPDAHDFLGFPNVLEEGGLTERVGYFVPCFKTNFECIDVNGNIDYNRAIELDDAKRAMAKLDKDPKALDRRKAEYPRNPSELFQRLDGNDFEVDKIDKQIRRILTQSSVKSLIRYGKLERCSTPNSIGGVEFVPVADANPVVQYPHGMKDDLSGAVAVLEKPWRDRLGLVPAGMYQVVFDSYYKDDADDLTSLFDIRVIKQDNPNDLTYSGLPVAWYTGRPKKLSTCHEILFMLCDYYNCSAQGEIGGGGQGVVDYAKPRRLLHRVEFEPEMLHNKEMASNMKNRSYLMNMPTERKRLGMTYLVEWHKEQIGIDENGVPILRLERIYDLGLLRELRKGGIRNSDRMSSMIIAMFMLKENIAKKVKVRKEGETFYDRKLFQETGYTETTTFC